MRILVLGLGNLLMKDDAFGVRAVEAIAAGYSFSGEVSLVDGGTLGLDLLPMFEEVEKLLVLDALDMDAEPGTFFRLQGEEVPTAFAGKLSVHQAGLQDLLAVADLQGRLPSELVVLGAQAGSVEMGLELTPPVAEALETVVEAALVQLEEWGATARREERCSIRSPLPCA